MGPGCPGIESTDPEMTNKSINSETGASADRRVALVTGASRGLGYDIALRLARDGLDVIVTSTQEDTCSRLEEQFASSGHENLFALPLNVESETSVTTLFSVLKEKFGRLDILVNNAGITPRVGGRKPLVEETRLEDWDRTLAINLTGTFLMTRAAIPFLKKGTNARVINMSSRGGRTRSFLSSGHYAAAKAGIIGFSRILAEELAPYGITVNCVAPSRIKTAMGDSVANPGEMDKAFIADTPLGRLGIPADVSHVVSFLAAPESSFLTGLVIDINGGQYMP